MDLESESSALESVGDNGLNQQSSINKGFDNNGSCSEESVKLASASMVREEGNDVTCVDSPGHAYSPVPKGQGLRKWRRIRRDLVNKDTHDENMDNSKVLKRGLSGLVHSHGKHMQFQAAQEVEQDSQGSVGSVNMSKVIGDGFEFLGTGYDTKFMAGVGFSAGVDSEKDDDRSSKSSTAARASKVFRYEKKSVISSGQRGKSRVENSKKHRGESVEIEKENSYSSLESDSRKQTVRVVDYNGENADEADMNGGSSKSKDYVEGEGEELMNKNNQFSEDMDPLAQAINGFFALQEALAKEVQQFQEIGKEPMPQHHEGATDSEVITLLNNVEELETKLKETRSMLKVKESHIRELESTTNQNKHSWEGTETVAEETFRQKTEAEIEYFIYSRSVDNLNSQMNLIEEQEALVGEHADKLMNKIGEVETKAANLANRAQDLQNQCTDTTGTVKNRACKTTTYFLIQMVLLITAVLLFMSQFFPESENVVPT
ncbi:unnamed protein product [Cochlearia groenlandica]